MAVWALRVGYLALLVVVAGLIAMWSGSTPWVLAAGMIFWLAAAAVMVTGFLRARHELPEPRPGFWSIRFMLIHDTSTLGRRPRGHSGPAEEHVRPRP